MPERRMYAEPEGVFLHDAVLDTCRKFPQRSAIVDYSSLIGREPKRLTYSEFGELIERCARGLVAAGVVPGDVIAIYLFNAWEYSVAYLATTLAGAVPTLLNPSYREREVRYQLENSGAVLLITDGPQTANVNLGGLPGLRRAYCTRTAAPGCSMFSELLAQTNAVLHRPAAGPRETLAALPFSSGTTGLPKGVMLSHFNLVANAFQTIRPGERAGFHEDENLLCFLPLYHIYGLNVLHNPILIRGGTLVFMPRFEAQQAGAIIAREQITYLPLVPPAMNALCHAAEQGLFPANHTVRAVKSGAAPLAPELPRRFTALTGIPVAQGYGMTEAAPVTHLGFIEPELYCPESIGHLAAQTEAKLIGADGIEVAAGKDGELVMRGPQFMRGYWKAPEATHEVLRDGWYWSGDIARRDERGFYFIVDRRKELIKFKGFAIAPAEIEAVLLEHPAVRDCGIVGKPDDDCGEIPVAFIVTRNGEKGSGKLATELSGHVAERLASYKQPREVRFVESIPRNPSGKILRRELRAIL